MPQNNDKLMNNIIVNYQAFHSRAVKQEEHLLKLCASLPDHLPGRNVPVSPAALQHPDIDLENRPNLLQQQREPISDPTTTKAQKSKTKKSKRIIPVIPFVTMDDLDAVPK